MSAESERTTWSSRASWLALGLALGCTGLFLVAQVVDDTLDFQRNRQGVLTEAAPRFLLMSLWAGEALAIASGIVSLLLMSAGHVPRHAVGGILIRSLAGMALGLCGTIVLWLVVGHMVFGF